MKASSMFACLFVSLVSAACADRSGEAAAPGMSPEVAAEIEDLCGLPAGALSGQAPISDAMPKIACAVEEARKRNIPIGFISNPMEPDR